jgi:hypothetical protein
MSSSILTSKSKFLSLEINSTPFVYTKYYVQNISLLEGTSVYGSRHIEVYSHTKFTLKACYNNIVSFSLVFRLKF